MSSAALRANCILFLPEMKLWSAGATQRPQKDFSENKHPNYQSLQILAICS